jgi:O-antigen/teichoic acid export membrane protein
LQKIASPKVADLWQHKDMLAMDKLYKRTSVVSFFVGAALFGAMVIGMDVLFDWLPSDYQAGYGVILIIGLTRVIDMLTGLNGVILLTSDYFKVDLFSNFALLLLAIILNILLIPVLHLEGAAWATASAILCANVFRLIFVWAKFKIQPFTWPILGTAALAVAAFALQYFIFYNIGGLPGAILKSILFGGLMLGGGIALGILPKKFWKILSN